MSEHEGVTHVQVHDESDIKIGEVESGVDRNKWDSAARKTLTALGGLAACWKRGPLGDQVEISGVRALHAWSTVRVTVTEARRVVNSERPYRNERLPAPTVRAADEVDPTDFHFFDADEDECVEFTDVEGSARVVKCLDCRAGKVPCAECDGTGRVEHDDCNGTGKIDCLQCGGTGREQGERGERNCTGCRGRGTTTCDGCSRGKVQCPECLGDKKTTCLSCSGSGKLVQVLQVEARRTRHLDVSTVRHPDLDPLLDLLKVHYAFAPPASDSLINDLEDMDDFELSTKAAATGFEEMAAKLLDPTVGDEQREFVREFLRRQVIEEEGKERQIQEMLDDSVVDDIAEQELAGPVLNRIRNALPLPSFADPASLRIRDRLIPLPDEDCDPLGATHAMHLFRSHVGKRLTYPKVTLDEVENKEIKGWLVRHSTKWIGGGGHVVRDHVLLVRQTWVCVDYVFEARNYRLFLGKHVFAPGGTPLWTEPTRLVKQAREAVQAGENHDASMALEAALEEPTMYWPDSEELTNLLTEIVGSSIPRPQRLVLLDIADTGIQVRSDGLDRIFDPDLGRATIAFVEACQKQVNAAETKKRTVRIAAVMAAAAVIVGVVVLVLQAGGAGSVSPSKVESAPGAGVESATQVPIEPEATHEVFGTNKDPKGEHWLSLKDEPKSGKKGVRILARMIDGTRLRVLSTGHGKRRRWMKVEVSSGEAQGKSGFVYSKYVRSLPDGAGE